MARVVTEVNSGNVKAIGFYRKNGYLYVRHEHFDYYALTTMEKIIAASVPLAAPDDGQTYGYPPRFNTLVQTVSVSHSPVLGLIAPPFTDITDQCRYAVVRMFKAHNKTGKPNLLRTVDLNETDPPDVASVCDGLDGSCGVLVLHAEFSEEWLDGLIKQSIVKGFFIIYSSTRPLKRGQYIQTGILEHAAVIDYFASNGYIDGNAISEKDYYRLPHNISAMKVLQEEVLDTGPGDQKYNQRALLSWPSYIRSYSEFRNACGQYLQRVKALVPGDADRNSQIVNYILTATVYTYSTTPEDFLRHVVRRQFFDEGPQNNSETLIPKILQTLVEYRLLSFETGEYNTSPFIREILKDYLESSPGEHLEIMCQIIGQLNEYRDSLSSSDFPLELINEVLRLITAMKSDDRTRYVSTLNEIYYLMSETLYCTDTPLYFDTLERFFSRERPTKNAQMVYLDLDFIYALCAVNDLRKSTEDALEIKKRFTDRWGTNAIYSAAVSEKLAALEFETMLVPQSQSKEGLFKAAERVPFNKTVPRLRTYIVFKTFSAYSEEATDFGRLDSLMRGCLDSLERGEPVSTSMAAACLNWTMADRRIKSVKAGESAGPVRGRSYVEPINLQPFYRYRRMFPVLFTRAIFNNIRIHLANSELSQAKNIFDTYRDFIKTVRIDAEMHHCIGDYYKASGNIGKALNHYGKSAMRYTHNGRYLDAITVKIEIMKLYAAKNDYDRMNDIRKELEEFLKSSSFGSRSTREWVGKAINDIYS